LVSPGHYLKALALGADAVYIGSIALLAMQRTQMMKALPYELPDQNVFYTGRYQEDLALRKGAVSLARYLKACVGEMELVARSVGKSALLDVDRSDLCATDLEIARLCQVDYANPSQPVV